MADQQTPSSALSSINIELEISIAAPRERVWQAITQEIGMWWRKDFYTSPATREFTLEPRLGGRMYEDMGDGAGLVWMTVVGLRPLEALELSGQLFPDFGGPAITQMRIALVEDGESTLVRLSDAIFGRIGPKLESDMTEGWKMLFEDGLKPYVEA